MRPDDSALAATTNDLTCEPTVREVADYVKFRMDSAAAPLEQLARYDGTLSVLATNRAERFGGEASEDGWLDRLREASRFEFVELVSVERAVARTEPEFIEEFRSDAALVVPITTSTERPIRRRWSIRQGARRVRRHRVSDRVSTQWG